MTVGEKAILVLKPNYGYGAEGAGGVIPGGATLVFEVRVSCTPREQVPARLAPWSRTACI